MILKLSMSAYRAGTMAIAVRTIANPTTAMSTIVSQLVKFHVMTFAPSMVRAFRLQQCC
jgi:hypothetical protein